MDSNRKNDELRIWQNKFYNLQREAPKPNVIPCLRHLDFRPPQYGVEYHGSISRQETEKLLENSPDGSYLIRNSQRAQNAYTLVIWFDKVAKNFMLYYDESTKQHYVGESRFDTIDLLVADGLIHFYVETRGADVLQKIAEANTYERTPFYKSRYHIFNAQALDIHPPSNFNNSNALTTGYHNKTFEAYDHNDKYKSPPRISQIGRPQSIDSSQFIRSSTQPIRVPTLESDLPPNHFSDKRLYRDWPPLATKNVRSDQSQTASVRHSTVIDVGLSRLGFESPSVYPILPDHASSTKLPTTTTTTTTINQIPLPPYVSNTKPDHVFTHSKYESPPFPNHSQSSSYPISASKHTVNQPTVVHDDLVHEFPTIRYPNLSSAGADISMAGSFSGGSGGSSSNSSRTSIPAKINDSVAPTVPIRDSSKSGTNSSFRKTLINPPINGSNSYPLQSNEPNTNSINLIDDKKNAVKNLQERYNLPAACVADQSAILSDIKPHNFKVHTFLGPHWCDYCTHYIWGLVGQGMRCAQCGFQAHKRCADRVPHDCPPDAKQMKRVFGVDLTNLVRNENRSVPTILVKCVEEIEQRGGLLREGLYRIPGNRDLVEELRLAFDKDSETVDLSESRVPDVNTLSSLIKAFFRELPVPLITYEAYSELIEIVRNTNLGEEEKLYYLKQILSHLPSAHYDSLQYFINHLSRVSEQYMSNMMSTTNLAIVLAPTLMSPSYTDPITCMAGAKYEHQLVNYLIKECSYLIPPSITDHPKSPSPEPAIETFLESPSPLTASSQTQNRLNAVVASSTVTSPSTPNHRNGTPSKKWSFFKSKSVVDTTTTPPTPSYPASPSITQDPPFLTQSDLRPSSPVVPPAQQYAASTQF